MTRLQTRIDAALVELEREGQLAPAQRAAVAARIQQALQTGRGHDFATVVAMLGGLLIAAGLLYLIGYNWEALGKLAKLALIFTVWGGLHAAGWWFAERRGQLAIGRAFTLVGVLAFGGAIGLVAQIYHLSAHYPNSILLWWLLSVPIVLVTGSRAILAAVLAVGLLWVGWHLGVWLDDHGARHGRDWLVNYLLVGMAVGASLLALVAAMPEPRRQLFGAVLRAPVLPLACAVPFGLAFHEPWWDMTPADLPAVRLLPVVVAAGCAALLIAVAAARRGVAAIRDPAILLGLLLLHGIVALAVPRGLPILANLVLFGGSLSLVALGVAEARGRLATWGIFLFVAGAVARYFEYLWDKLEGAYAFLASGALLLAAAFLFENRRRAVAARLREHRP